MSFDPRDAYEGGMISDCCGMPFMEGGMCSSCKEHCESVREGEDEEGPSDAQLSQSTERHWQEEEKYRSEMIDSGRGHLLP